MRNGRRLCRWACLALVLAAAAVAEAQPVDDATKATARTLAEEGLSHFDAGRWQPALERFERADALVHAPTMSLLAGRCLEKLGRLVEASERYQVAARAEVGPGASAAFKEAVADAVAAQKALLPRIPRLEVGLRGAPASAVEVTIDGSPLPAAMLGAARLTDPGVHALRARRGGEVVDRSVDLREGQSLAVTLELHEAEVPAGPGPGSTQRVIGWTTLAVGGAGLVAGGVTLGLGLSAKSGLVSHWGCSADLVCPPASEGAVSRYRALRTANAATFAAGAAGAVAGVILLVAAPRARSVEKSAWHPWIGPDRVGIEGAF